MSFLLKHIMSIITCSIIGERRESTIGTSHRNVFFFNFFPRFFRRWNNSNQLVDDVQYAVGQGNVADDNTGSVDSYTVRVATDAQKLAVEGEQVIAIDQTRHEPGATNDMAPQ